MQTTNPGPNGTQTDACSYDLKANYVLNAVVVSNGDTVMKITRNQEPYTKRASDPQLDNGTKRNVLFIQQNYLPVFKARYAIHKNRLG